MGLDTASVNHTCNVIRRQIQEEFPNLTLFFIVHENGKEKDALQAKSLELQKHTGGGKFLKALQKSIEKGEKLSGFYGLHAAKKKKLLPVFDRKQYLACFFVNAGRFEKAENARHHAYALSWHALSLYLQTENDTKNAAKAGEKILRPKSENEMQTAYDNMLADVFAAIIQELYEHTGMIQKLARQRSLMTLTPTPGFRAEKYPYLLAYDTAQIVYSDFGHLSAQKGPFVRAADMTREIAETYDLNDMRQWEAFSSAAQEMAWMDIDKHKILGAAVFSSEDPYVRSTAHLVAEALNVEPVMLASFDYFNPFADQEINERQHNKARDDLFEELIEQVKNTEDPYLFIKEAHIQNKDLINGKPIGWCAYGLIKATDIYELSKTEGRDFLAEAKEAFKQGCAETPWQAVREMSRIITDLRRDGQKISPATLIDFSRQNEELYPFVHAFAINLESGMESETHTKNEETQEKTKEAIEMPYEAPAEEINPENLQEISKNLEIEE